MLVSGRMRMYRHVANEVVTSETLSIARALAVC